MITGDGDGLSIGGNHLIHACRRNVDINIILFNNRIYGLTKGQYSPTSPQGFHSKTSPMGTIEQPLNPISVALAAEATFIARTIDVMQKHIGEVLHASAEHKGASFVEVFQNCNIFNDGAFQHQSDRKERDDYNLYLEDGQPMVFGKNHDKGLVLIDGELRTVMLGEQHSESDLLVHDTSSIGIAWLLSRLQFPTPLGVIFNVVKPSYSEGSGIRSDRRKSRWAKVTSSNSTTPVKPGRWSNPFLDRFPSVIPTKIKKSPSELDGPFL